SRRGLAVRETTGPLEGIQEWSNYSVCFHATAEKNLVAADVLTVNSRVARVIDRDGSAVQRYAREEAPGTGKRPNARSQENRDADLSLTAKRASRRRSIRIQRQFPSKQVPNRVLTRKNKHQFCRLDAKLKSHVAAADFYERWRYPESIVI